MLKRLIPVFIFLFTLLELRAQDSDSLQQIPSRYLDEVSSKAERLQQKLNKKGIKALNKLQRQESRITGKLEKTDSSKAAFIFHSGKRQYKELEQRLKKTLSLRQYIPSLDTLGTTLEFLQQNPQLLSGAISANQKLNEAISEVNGLEQQFQKAEEIKNFIQERKRFIKEQLEKLGFAKELKRISKNAYYYQAQVTEYKEVLKDHKKIEKKAIELLTKTKFFNDFMQKNSFLARLFPMPAGGNPGNISQQATGFAALQTRAQVSSFIQQTGMAGQTGMSQMQQNIQGAQSELNELRNKLAQMGAGGDDLEIPDFKINPYKTKSFLKRLEFGMNFQSQKARSFFPGTNDLGLSIGYKLNTKSIIGIGASYKFGLGTGWNKIKLTHEGLGLRSFIDWKIKGNFWISGGYEQNYLNRFITIDELKDQRAWQQSGLLGLTKTGSLKSNFLKKAKLQLLWDFLSYRQVPVTQPLLFRIGYNF